MLPKRTVRQRTLAFGATTFCCIALSVANPLSASAETQFTVLHAFSNTDGAHPRGTLAIRRTDRPAPQRPILHLYGTAADGGGCCGGGVVFELRTLEETSKPRPWTLGSTTDVLRAPYAGLIQGSSSVTGATSSGGAFGGGYVFTIFLTQAGALRKAATRWQGHRFKAEPHPGYVRGAHPTGRLVRTPQGLFGTTKLGGPAGVGVIFKHAGRRKIEILHRFNGEDGAEPAAGLVAGSDGEFYGTTSKGGAFGLGTVFRLSPPEQADGPWQHKVLLDFRAELGAYPQASLILNTNGALFGTTEAGGMFNRGTVFRLRPPMPGQTEWRHSVLHSFNRDDGAHPVAELASNGQGALFGTTREGGAFEQGTIFRLTPPSTPNAEWSQTTLHSFSGSDGSRPVAGLAMDIDGTLYGVAAFGGPSKACAKDGCGVVFKLVP